MKDRESGEWKTERDFGWEIELHSGGAGKDYWQISTRDGTRYRFGATDGSNLWVPVVGDDPGEPHYDSYPTSFRETWRWNLDRVVDANENRATLVWQEETNHYKRWLSGNVLAYDRGAYLDQIDYGHNGSVAGSSPTGKVEFWSRNRCVEATVRDDPVGNPYPSGPCPPVNEANASSYPDVPVDLKCGSSSCDQFSPTFWSSKRLEAITTFKAMPDGTWRNIYRLHLRFKTLNPPGLTGRVLWLDRIFPVGLIGSDANKQRLPGVNFNVEYLSGRVDHDEAGLGVSEMVLPRVYRILNGYGGRTDITYGHVAPCPTGGSDTTEYQDWYDSKVGNWDVNTDECAPVWYKPEGAPAGWGEFHKYLALKVVDEDRVGDSPDVVTEYEYRGEAAWALGYGFIDSEGTTESWNEWRGYPTVRVHTGEASLVSTMTEHTFFRGLYHDYFDDWQTLKHVSLTDYDGNTFSDLLARAGKPLQVRHYEITGHHSDPAQRTFHELSSSRFWYRGNATGDGPGLRNPYVAQLTRQHNRVRLADGSWRPDSERVMAFDEYGLPTEIVDWNNPEEGADSTCTSITYARRDDGNWYNIDFPETVEVWGDAVCGTGELLSRTVTLYDGRTSGDLGSQNPSDGNPTEVRTYTSGSKFVATKANYDNYGRTTSTTDETGQVTTVDHSPAANWPVDGVTTTNPAGQSTTTRVSPSNGKPWLVTDANGKRTDVNFDQFGRPVEVFLPADPTSEGIPSLRFDYQYTWNGTTGQPSAATRVGTHTLRSKAGGGEYLSSYVFDDGFGRPRETQTASPAGGRIVEATYYSVRGLEKKVSAPFHSSGQPGDGLVNPSTGTLPSWTSFSYDELDRVVGILKFSGGFLQWRTTTEYFGDHATTTPPGGAPPVTTWTDVRGNTTLRQEHLQTGGTVDTAYRWDLKDQLVGVTDDAGNEWSYSYDLAGRKVEAVDPDAGTTSYTYDGAGRLLTTTDARGQTVSTDHDVLGRPVSRWDGASGSGTLLAEWVYDTLAAGQLSSSTRWHDGQAYTTSVDGYDDRYRPVGMTVSIPAVEGPLAGDYAFGYTYTDAGQPESVTLPAAGGLPAETVTTSYTGLGRTDRLTSDLAGGTTYVDAASYDKTGDLVQQLLGAPGAGTQVARDLAWDEATGRLDSITTVTGADGAAPTTVQDDAYAYDDPGNLTSVTDRVTGQAQCFEYDGLRRLTEAWTTVSAACGDGPSSAVVDGPDPYWHSWTFDTVGNRLTQTEHPTAAGGEEVTTSYSYPAPGGPRPHTLVEKSVTDPSGTVVTGYDYDQTGNTTSRPGHDGNQQTLTWGPEGHLATVAGESGTSDYVYDVDGNRLLAHHADGSAVLYLPEGMEVHADPGGGTSCVRYYGGVAVRADTGGLTWLAADHHGTGVHAIDAGTLDVVTRRSSPYGNPRGPVSGGAWPDDKGFLGAPADPTGLTHLGAREYDPSIGRFISVDPVMDLTDPQQMHGYAYANSSPLTWSDPTGLIMRRCLDFCGSRADRSLQRQRSKSSRSGRSSPRRDLPTGLRRGGSSPAHRNGGHSVGKSNHIVRKTLEYGTTYALRKDGLIMINGFLLPEGAPPSADLAPLVDQILYEHGLPPDQVYWAVSVICQERMLECGYEFTRAVWHLDIAQLYNVDSWEKALAIGVAESFAIFAPGPSGRISGRGACRNSFESGTLVLMADGTHKPIEDVQPGDLVLATDPETGRTEPKPVVKTITGHGDKTMVDVTVASNSSHPGTTTAGRTLPIADDDGQLWIATVTATADHQFWVGSQAAWVVARDLEVGSQLRAPNGSSVSVLSVDVQQLSLTVYDLAIAHVPTYHVLVGEAPVLVHNDGRDRTGTIFRSGKYVFQIYSGDHGPPHGHLKGYGFDIKIGQNGKPVNPNVSLTREQQRIVNDHLRTIRKSIRARMAEYRANRC